MTHVQKRPSSVLVVLHTPDLQILLLERLSPSGFWQSVTGSLETGETCLQAAARELEEETGLPCPDQNAFRDWGLSNRFLIPTSALPRYPAGCRYNNERVLSYRCQAPFPPRISPTEHRQGLWLPWEKAVLLSNSWTNRDAIRLVAASDPL